MTDKPITIYSDGKQVRDILHVSDLVELRLKWLAPALAMLLLGGVLLELDGDPLLKFASTYTALLLGMLGASGLPLSLTWTVRRKLKRLGGGEALDLNALMSEAARNVGLRWRPEVGLIKSKAVNAAVTIIPFRVTVLSGLLEALSPSEIEAVFEPECSHPNACTTLRSWSPTPSWSRR